MTPASQTLAYQGNVGLGLNSSGSAVGAYGDTDLKEASTQLFNLAYMNMQKNKAVWEQKIKDRDDGAREIASGRLAIQNALPKDRERLMGMIEDVKKVYLDNGGDVKSNPNVWLDLQDKLAKFNNANLTSSSRYLTYTQGAAETAKETNPFKKKKMQEHWNGQLNKDLYELFDPYQQSLDWDGNIIRRPLKMITTPTGKIDGFNREVTTRTDLADSYRDYVNEFQQGDKEEVGANIGAFLDSFYGRDGIMDAQQVQEKAQEVNNRLRQIAKDEGFDPDNISSLPDYLRPLKARLVDGKVQSGDYAWNDWFKIQLYDQYQKPKTASVFDKDLLESAKGRATIGKDNALGSAAMIRARAAANRDNAAAQKSRAGTKLLEQQTTPKEFFDEMLTKSFGTTTTQSHLTRVNWDDLSEGAQKALGVQPLTANNGKERFVNLVPANVTLIGADGQPETYSEEAVENYYQRALRAGEKSTKIEFLRKIGANFNIEAQGRTPTGIGRANRQSTFTRQAGMMKKDFYTEEDNTPAEVDE